MQKPMPGTPCANDGLACAYDADSAGYVSLFSCKSTWSESVIVCGKATCNPDTGGSQVTLGAVCGASGERHCSVTLAGTRYERLSHTMQEIASCCGLFTEDTLTVWFEDGCATHIRVGKSDDFGQATAACARELLEGYRVECSTGVECVEVQFSTLK